MTNFKRRRRQLLKSLRTAEALKSQKLPDVPLIMQALPGSRAKLTHMRTFALASESGFRVLDKPPCAFRKAACDERIHPIAFASQLWRKVDGQRGMVIPLQGNVTESNQKIPVGSLARTQSQSRRLPKDTQSSACVVD